MIPRYRTRFQVSKANGAVGRDALVNGIRRWISIVERTDVPPLGDAPLRLPSGSEVVVQDLVTPARSLHAIQYARPQNGLLWTTEVGFEPRAADTLVHVGLSSAVNDPVQRRGRTFPPGIVSVLVKEYEASAGMPLSERPIDVMADADVVAFLELLRAPQRVLPVVCVTLDQFTEEPRMDPDALQRRVIGLAQVVVLHKRAGHRFTQLLRDQLGSRDAANKLTAFDGAVRVYWPDPELIVPGANPFRHRLLFPGSTAHEREILENELFDVLSWAAIHKDEADWLDLASLQRLRDRHTIEVERERANADASLYEGICKNLESDRTGLEARLKEAVQRAEDSEGDLASLQYQYRVVTEQITELRKRLPDGDDENAEGSSWTVVCYHRGGDRDCVDEAASSDEERSELRERLSWLASPESWAKPAGKLENLRDGVYEYRVNVKDHCFRLLVARLAKLRTVVVLHAFPKKSNELPAAEIKTAVERLRDLG